MLDACHVKSVKLTDWPTLPPLSTAVARPVECSTMKHWTSCVKLTFLCNLLRYTSFPPLLHTSTWCAICHSGCLMVAYIRTYMEWFVLFLVATVVLVLTVSVSPFFAV